MEHGQNHTPGAYSVYLFIFSKGVSTDAIDEPFNPRDEECHRPSSTRKQNAVKSMVEHANARPGRRHSFHSLKFSLCGPAHSARGCERNKKKLERKETKQEKVWAD